MKKISPKRFFKNYKEVAKLMQTFPRSMSRENALLIVEKSFYNYDMNGLANISGKDARSLFRFGFKLRETYENEKSSFEYGGIGFIERKNKKLGSDGAVDFLFERGKIFSGCTGDGDTYHLRIKNGKLEESKTC